jgi:DNA-binding transcriptional ArsR family regulator
MRRDVFQAIADPTRREIISLLASEQLNLNAIADKFEISRPAISKHIKILMECGLLTIKQEGRERYCKADYKKLNEVATWVEQYRYFWNNKMDALDKFLSQEPDSKTD